MSNDPCFFCGCEIRKSNPFEPVELNTYSNETTYVHSYCALAYEKRTPEYIDRKTVEVFSRVIDRDFIKERIGLNSPSSSALSKQGRWKR